MKKIQKNLFIALLGLATSVLTALFVTAISQLSKVSIFTISVLFVIPIGAFFTGMLAASGNYFGSLIFNKAPDTLLLIQVLVASGLSQIVIYYISYILLELDRGEKVKTIITFSEYLGIILTSSHYQIGRQMFDVGEIGLFGYILASIQFLGFVAGGLFIFIILKNKRICKNCNMYFRNIGVLTRNFQDKTTAAIYYENIISCLRTPNELSDIIGLDVSVKTKKGVVSISTNLQECPNCKQQIIEDNVEIFDGKEWYKKNELYRVSLVPPSINLVSVFKAKKHFKIAKMGRQ